MKWKEAKIHGDLILRKNTCDEKVWHFWLKSEKDIRNSYINMSEIVLLLTGLVPCFQGPS